jgi:hypothetical protein
MTGKTFLFRHIPELLITRANEQEMSVDFSSGSRIQLLGSDNIDSIVGSNPVGIAYTEYAMQSPLAWEMLRPILMQNHGFALFNSTPRGQTIFTRCICARSTRKIGF